MLVDVHILYTDESFSNLFSRILDIKKRLNPWCDKGSNVSNTILKKNDIAMKTSQEGFEPPTDALEGHCSIRLSY